MNINIIKAVKNLVRSSSTGDIIRYYLRGTVRLSKEKKVNITPEQQQAIESLLGQLDETRVCEAIVAGVKKS